MSRLTGRAVQDEGGLRRTHVNDLLRIAVEHGASDLHLKVGSYPMMRVRGELVPAANDRRLDHEDTDAMAAAVILQDYLDANAGGRGAEGTAEDADL